MGVIASTRQIGDAITTKHRYFLFSLPADAKSFARTVRSHWQIENVLHWVLDVSLQIFPIRMSSHGENLRIPSYRNPDISEFRPQPKNEIQVGADLRFQASFFRGLATRHRL